MNLTPKHTEVIQKVTKRIQERSKKTRNEYLERLKRAKDSKKITRDKLGCTNLAHAYATIPNELSKELKNKIQNNLNPNFAIITSYNDMLSAHQPFSKYPDIIKSEVFKNGGMAQVASGTPAMCDGITQGFEGMELSLFSRDVIALSTAIGLSHNVFDGAFYLGVCDKIVPGLLIGALSFGHLPSIFIPSGPMTSGISNSEKANIRQLFAEGKVDRQELLKSEMKSYHGVGTCTFYGTANSNQMLIEILGLHIPNSAFINPLTKLRDELTKYAAKHLTVEFQNIKPIGEIINEKSIVNALIGLMATGGSTNHTIHLIAIARAAGIIINWDDFNDISSVTPLIARIYPNGKADINNFYASGGLAFVIRELLDSLFLHEDVHTVAGFGLRHYTKEPFLIENKVIWKEALTLSLNEDIIRSINNPFSKDGGLKLMSGNIGRGIIKVSAVHLDHQFIKAKAIVFNDQNEFLESFKKGELEKDFIAVLRFQGAKANGMPELHKLTPPLGVLQDKGFKVALITDGRMSGASGKVPTAIHISPETLLGGNIGKIVNGDLILFDAINGVLDVLESDFEKREVAVFKNKQTNGFGRELFNFFRASSSSAENGAMSFGIVND